MSPLKHIYYDTETNGLLPPETRYPKGSPMLQHCMAITDMETGDEHYYGPAVPKDFDWMGWELDPAHRHALENPSGTAEDGARVIMASERSIAHNGIDFDYRSLEMSYPWFRRPPEAWDSMVMAKVVWPTDTLIGPDLALIKKGRMPAFLLKRHSLKAWGYRLGENKDEYAGDLRIADEEERKARKWAEWNPFMAAYMMQDNRPGVKLMKLLYRRIGWEEPEKADIVWPKLTMVVENEVARIIVEQTQHGVNFDMQRAVALSTELANTQAELEAKLIEVFGSWWAMGKPRVQGAEVNLKHTHRPDVTMRRFSDKTGKELKPYVGPPLETRFEGAEIVPVERLTYSPGSRDHLGQRLQDVYGWVPKAFGADGKPTVDESTLAEISESVMPAEVRTMILDYFVVSKTLGTLTKGRKSWMHLVQEDGRVHGTMDTAGAVTGRGTHKDPNLSGTPGVRKEKVEVDGKKVEQVLKGLKGRYGWECRELFCADEGWEQTGVDASSLELIDLGHYLTPLDGGKFSERVCDPSRDPHQEHADLTGLTRGDVKTATYLKVYGGSAYKLSLGIDMGEDEIPDYIGYRGLPMLLASLVKRFDQSFVDKMDDYQKAKLAKARTIILKLERGIEGLKELSENVQEVAKRRGWLKGMDGRKLHVRKPHAALNTLLQSAGAQTCKLWIVLTHQKLAARGLVSGVDFKQILWVHDEMQFTHRPGLGPVIRDCAYEAIREAGEMLGLKGQYRGDAKTGRNWAECH